MSFCSGSWTKTICHYYGWCFNSIDRQEYHSFTLRTITQLVWPTSQLIRIKLDRNCRFKELTCGDCAKSIESLSTHWIRTELFSDRLDIEAAGVDKWLIKFSVKVENYDCVINVCLSQTVRQTNWANRENDRLTWIGCDKDNLGNWRIPINTELR